MVWIVQNRERKSRDTFPLIFIFIIRSKQTFKPYIHMYSMWYFISISKTLWSVIVIGKKVAGKIGSLLQSKLLGRLELWKASVAAIWPPSLGRVHRGGKAPIMRRTKNPGNPLNRCVFESLSPTQPDPVLVAYVL